MSPKLSPNLSELLDKAAEPSPKRSLRFAVDFNNSAYADPYVTGTPYLASREEAESFANDILPILDDAARWAIVVAAAERGRPATVGQAPQYSALDLTDEQLGAFVRAMIEDETAALTTDPSDDVRSYATLVSEDTDASGEPRVEEIYYRRAP